jgi:hypothetical protein
MTRQPAAREVREVAQPRRREGGPGQLGYAWTGPKRQPAAPRPSDAA